MKKFQIIISLGIILSLASILVGPIIEIVLGASITNHRNALSRLRVSVDANHEWQFVSPAGVNATTDTIIYEFDIPGTAFDLTGVVLGDIDLLEDTDGIPGDCAGILSQEILVSVDTGATNEWLININTTLDNITVSPASVNDTAAITAANACIILRVGNNAIGGVNQINNPAGAGIYRIGVSGTFGNIGETAVQIITDDQVAATAAVDSIISFSISTSSISFGTLTTTNARFANTTGGSATEVIAHTITASTNATNGYVITVNGTTLTSGLNTITAIGATPTASSPSIEQYGIKAIASGGAGVVAAPYNTSNFAFDTAAFPDQFASVSTPSVATTYSLTYVANISAITEAGSYVSALTYVATGTF